VRCALLCGEKDNATFSCCGKETKGQKNRDSFSVAISYYLRMPLNTPTSLWKGENMWWVRWVYDKHANMYISKATPCVPGEGVCERKNKHVDRYMCSISNKSKLADNTCPKRGNKRVEGKWNEGLLNNDEKRRVCRPRRDYIQLPDYILNDNDEELHVIRQVQDR